MSNWLISDDKQAMLTKIKESLEKDGFETSWRDPFFELMHGRITGEEKSKTEIGDRLYICNLPIYKIVPFDLATVSITLDEQINFQLSLYYIKILEDEVDGDMINNIFDRHATDWSVKRTDYFSDIASQFSLHWNTEYDVFIEDALYGQFPIESPEKIISIMNVIKVRYLENLYSRIRQQYEDAVGVLEQENPDNAEELKALKYSVCFTNPLNTLRKGPVYYLGFNPGGSIENREDFQDFENLASFKKKDINWCAFVNEKWKYKNKEFSPGEAPLQRKVKTILEEILSLLNAETDIKNVFSTNLYFFRSNKAVDIFKYKKYDCWDYHEEFLKIVRPKIIVCNGNAEKLSAYTDFKKRIGTSNKIRENESEHDYNTYSMKSFVIENSSWRVPNVLVVGFPHLSRYTVAESHKIKWSQYIRKHMA